MREQAENTARQERAIKRFLRDFLDKPKDGQSFDPILARVGRYYDADRVYIFELSAERTHVRSTHAWHREGVPEQGVSLQEIDPKAFLRWMEARGEDGELYLGAQSAQQDPETARFLRARGLEGMTGTALWRPSSARGAWTI